MNVPNPTISTTSPFVKAEANTTELPEVIVISELDIRTPLTNTSANPASYASVFPFASAPETVVGVPVMLYVNLAEVPLIVDPAAAQPEDL